MRLLPVTENCVFSQINTQSIIQILLLIHGEIIQENVPYKKLKPV